MTNTASTYTQPNWDFDWFNPQPQQDSQLLENFGFIPGLKELLLLRQVHALEHATVWILSENLHNSSSESQGDNQNLGGLSTDKGFYLYGNVQLNSLKFAVNQALNRLKAGDWHLAIHPRCGTNASVEMLLMGIFTIGNHLIFPKELISQLTGFGLATATAAYLAPDLGKSVQKYLTTSIPFNLSITEIKQTKDSFGRKAYFVGVKWN